MHLTWTWVEIEPVLDWYLSWGWVILFKCWSSWPAVCEFLNFENPSMQSKVMNKFIICIRKVLFWSSKVNFWTKKVNFWLLNTNQFLTLKYKFLTLDDLFWPKKELFYPKACLHLIVIFEIFWGPAGHISYFLILLVWISIFFNFKK